MDRINRFLDHFRPGPYKGYTKRSWDDETRRINEEMQDETLRLARKFQDAGYEVTPATDPITGYPVLRFTKDVERG